MNHSIVRLFTLFSLTVIALVAAASERVVSWDLPADWEAGVRYNSVEGYVDVVGGELARRYGLGAVGEPDLPTLTVQVALPQRGSCVGATVAAVEWTKVETQGAMPLPIAEPVPYGTRLVYPQPEAGAYGEVYPSSWVQAGTVAIEGGVRMVPVTVTPYKWDGPSKTLYKASAMKIAVTLEVPRTARLASASAASSASPNSARSRALARTINPEDASTGGGIRLLSTPMEAATKVGQIIIVSPSEFVDLWKGYAAFRKSTEAGKDFEYVIVNTMDIYTNATYWTKHCSQPVHFVRQDSVDALAIHHYLEEVYDPEREQYILLGAAPAKYGYDRATMVPARYVVNQNSYDQVCDMYYGYMDRIDGSGARIERSAVDEDSPEVWDYDCDGYYMGKQNAGGGYTSDNNAYVDWEMDVPVTRVPLMREYVEVSGGTTYRLTAAKIMENFTNNIAFAESETEWDSTKRWRHVLGGGYLFNSYARGSSDYLVRGERTFFDGGVNHFDEAHSSPTPDAEACPRTRNLEHYSYYRAARHALINTGGLKTCDWGNLYKNYGDCFDVHCHGWARGADPGTTGGALFSTGLWRVYNMALPCETGMYDYYCKYNGVNQGYTNCCSMGEAPLLCFNPRAGGLVTFNNTRYGWWGGYNGMSSYMEGLVNRAFYQHDLNAGQACKWIHNTSTLKTTYSRGGACNLEVVVHGDPLIRISPQYSRTWNAAAANRVWSTNAVDGAAWDIAGREGLQPADYSKELSVDTSFLEGAQTFTITGGCDLAAARFRLKGADGQRIVLTGEGTFRTTDSTVITNADLTWNVAGGAGRNGIVFAGDTPRNLTFEGSAARYVGYQVKNVDNLEVNGCNVTFDFDHGVKAASAFQVNRFALGGTQLQESYNVLRTRAEGFFAKETTIPVVNNRLELQTLNIGGGTPDLREWPLFYLTNSYLKVTYNPYWGTEYFVRPTYMTNARLVGEYAKFGLGRPEGYGYDLYVWGTSYIEGSVPILLTGELRVHLMDANATLVIANTLSDGHGGMEGSLKIIGKGKVRVTAPQTFTGGIVVGDTATLELAIAQAVRCDVEVEGGASLKLNEIPLEGVKTITLRKDSKTVLPYSTGAGIYQVIDSATSAIEREDGALIYDAKDLKEPLDATLSEGYLLLNRNLIYWQPASGAWVNDASATTVWKDASDAAIGFTNTMPVVFGDVKDAERVQVTVDETLQPGFVDFRNAGCPYAFVGSGSLTLESLACGNVVDFGVDLALGNVLKVVGGSLTTRNVSASLVEVTGGGTLHVRGTVSEPQKMVRSIRFSFSESMSSAEIPAVQELRLFRDGAFVPLPTGTLIEDIAGQKIRITGCNGYVHTWEWLNGTDGNETLRALVDGNLSGGNKWWASKNAAPTWFTITFPEPIAPITGYSLCTADAGQKNRNPKSWSVSTSPGTDNFTLAGEVSGLESTQSSYWLGGGNGTSAAFTMVVVDGALTVHDGGTLVADGAVKMNLKLESGATLAVAGSGVLSNAHQAATLTLPAQEASVLVDASAATETTTAFPILCGYGLTAQDFLKFRCITETAVLNLRDGDLYLVTSGIQEPPYSASVTEAGGTTNWSALVWRDAIGTPFTWDENVNYRADGTANLNLDWVDGQPTIIGLNIGGALGTLNVNGRATDRVTLRWMSALVPRTLVFSNYMGSVVLDYGDQSALGYSDFIAGRDTEIPAPSSGSLLIPAGMRAVIPSWGDFARVTGEGTVALRAAQKGTDIASGWGNRVGVTGTLELLRGTWTVANATDYPKYRDILIGAEGVLKLTTVNDTTGYNVYTNALTLADGGELNVDKRDTFDRPLVLRNGGRLTFTRDVSDSNRVFDFFNNSSVRATGEHPNFIGGSAAKTDAETGDATVDSGIVALRRPGDFTVEVDEGSELDVFAQWGGGAGTTYPWKKTGKGVLAFYRGSDQTGNLRVEAGVLRLVNRGQATQGEIVNQGELQVVASNGFTQTVANAIKGTGSLRKLGLGTTVLTGVNTYAGLTTVEEGVLRVDGKSALGASSVWMLGGTLDMGSQRLAGYTVDAPPSVAYAGGFRIRAELASSEIGKQVPLVKLGGFAEALTVGELKQVFELWVNGQQLPLEEYKIVLSGGVAEYQPDQLSGYSFPLETTVSAVGEWKGFAWFDQNHVAFTNDWSEYPQATAKVNVDPDCGGTMLVDGSVLLSRLTVNNKGGTLVIGGGSGRFAVTDGIDTTGCGEGSVTFLDFDLGACNIDTGDGEVILRPGCTGTLTTQPRSVVTLTNGTGRGTAVLAAGSELRFLGTQRMNELLWSSVDNRTGAWIGYGFPITADEIAFGGVGDNSGETDGNFHFQGNLQLVARRFVTGNGKGTKEKFRQTGGTIDVTGDGNGLTTTGSTVLMAHWPSTVDWEQRGGSFVATNAPTVFGWDGQVNWTMSGGLTRLRGLWASRVSGHDNSSSFTLAGGRLEIGDLGIAFTNRAARNASLTLSGGTLAAYADTAVAVEKGIAVASDSTLYAPADVVMTVAAPISSSGVLTATGEGTVRYAGACASAKLAGRFQFVITRQVRDASASTALFTLPDGATMPNVTLVDEAGEPAVGGNGAAANGQYHWVPSGKHVMPVTTTLSAGVALLHNTTWQDAAGNAVAYDDLTDDMELVINAPSDTLLKIYDTRNYGTVRFIGNGQLTLANYAAVIGYVFTVAKAEIRDNLTISSGGIVLTEVSALDEDASLTVNTADNITSFGSGVFKGHLRCNGFLPGWKVFSDANRWQGVLTIDKDVTMADSNLNAWGNAASTLEMVGLWNGYLPKAGTCNTAVKVTGTLKFSNGYSTDGGYVFAKALSGGGTLVGTTNPNGNAITDVIAFTGDCSGFTGSIDLKGGHCFAFGSQIDDNTCQSTIVVTSPSARIAAGSTWNADNGILVKAGGVLTVVGTEAYASTSKVTVNAGGTLNLEREDETVVRFPITDKELKLDGALTLNGLQVPDWGYEQQGGTIVLKDKAVCVLPVTADVTGDVKLSTLRFFDSAVTPNAFTIEELLLVDDLEVDFSFAEGARLTVDTNLNASVFKLLGAKSVVSGPTGETAVHAGVDSELDTPGAGTLVVADGMKATVPSWSGAVDLRRGGWLTFTATDSPSVKVADYTPAGATFELAGRQVIAADQQVGADSTLVLSGEIDTSNVENGLRPGATMIVKSGKTTLLHRFIMSQGAGGASSVVVTGGELASGDTLGHLYVGGYAGSTANVTVSGGRFTSRYAVYKDGNGVNGCFGNFAAYGEGVFAPKAITRAVNDALESPVADVAVSGGTYAHHLDLGDGGTFEAPDVVPNWFAVNVTNGVAALAAQALDGTIDARGPISIAKDCTLKLTGGTLKLRGAVSGEGTLRVEEGATLDLNGFELSNVTGSGTVTNSATTGALVYTGEFETNLTFACAVKVRNAAVNVDAFTQEIELIRKGNGTIVEFTGVRVKVNGVMDRNTWRLSDSARGIIACVPYAAELTKTTNWDDGKGEGLRNHGIFMNDPAYSILITNLAQNATLTFNTLATASGLRWVSAVGTESTIAASAPLTVGSYDFSESLGKVTLAVNSGSALVTAGADTWFTAGGTGTLTIPAGATATVSEEFGHYANDGTLRRDYACGARDYASFLQGDTATTNSFKSVVFTGGMQAAKAVIRVLPGDSVTFKGTSDNYGARTTASFDIRGGEVTLEANAADTWFGAPGVTTFRQSGGVFRATADNQSQNGNVGFMFGYANKSEDLPFDLSGGAFLVENTSLNFYDCPVIRLCGMARMRAKGVFAAKSQAVIAIEDLARFELGSLGWKVDSARLTMNGGTFTTFADATMNDAITLGGADAILAAQAGTTLTLKGVVSGPFPLTLGSVVSNDTGTVRAQDGTFACGALTLAAGTLSVPAGTLTNDVQILANGHLDLTSETVGRAEYVLTAGRVTGETANVTFNGQPLAAAKLKLSDDGRKLLSTVAVEPFRLTLDSSLETSWTNAPWMGANGIAVQPEQWMKSVRQAAIAVANEEAAVTLTVDFPLALSELVITNNAALRVAFATADFELGTVEAEGSTVAPVFALVDQDGVTLDESKLGFGGLPLVVACGTRFSPLTVVSSTGSLDARPLSVASGATLRLLEKSTGAGNRVWTVSGSGADQSTLILSAERGLGFNAGSSFTNLTLVVDAAIAEKKTYLEQRSDDEKLTDPSVDLVVTNGSTVIVQGSSTYRTTIEVGNLAGDGPITDGGYKTGTLAVNLTRDGAYSGAITVPLEVKGAHTLTLTGNVTGSIAAEAGTTVRLAPTDSLSPASLAGEGDFRLDGGVLRLSPATSEARLVVAADARIDLMATSGDAFEITSGPLVFGEGASITNNITVGGQPLLGTWKLNGGTITRTRAETPFWLRTETDLASGFSLAAWRGTNDIPVAADDWDRTLDAVVVDTAEGCRTDLTVDRALSIATLVATNAGTLALNPSGGLTLANATVLDIAREAKVVVPGWKAASVAGRGTIAFDSGARDTAVAVSGAFDANAFFGGILLERGTWNLTGNYPVWFYIQASGSEAILRFNKQDLTGYGHNYPELTISDGATLRISKRDTFDRPLVLVNGAKVVFDADDIDSGRAFDLFTRSSITVRGETPCSLGDPATRIGIVAIRRKDFTVDVDEGSSLDVYARLSTAAGNGGSLVKTGSGDLRCHRAATSALPLAIHAGRVWYVGDGSASTAGTTVSEGATFGFDLTDGTSRTFAATVSGAGELVKKGAGSLTLTANNAHSGGTRVLDGTLIVGAAGALGSGPLSVADGAVVDFGTHRAFLQSLDTTQGTYRFTLVAAETNATELIRLIACNGDAVPENVEVTYPDGEPVGSLAVRDGWLLYRSPKVDIANPLVLRNPSDGTWSGADWRENDGSPWTRSWTTAGLTARVERVTAPTTLALDETVALDVLDVRDGVLDVHSTNGLLSVRRLLLGADAEVTVGDRFFGDGALTVSGGTTVDAPSSATLAFDLGATNVQRIVGVNDTDADRRYAIKVKSGTLAFENDGNGTTLFNGRTVTADGADAVLKLVKGDTTGWDGGCRRIVLRNGGTLAVAKRDTFKMPVWMEGGNLLLLKGSATSNRAFDLFGNNEWTVTNGVSRILCEEGATGYDRYVMLRQGDWNLDIAADAELVVDARLVRNLDNVGGRLVKDGRGTLRLNESGDYDKGTLLKAGTTIVSNADALGSGTVTISDSAVLEIALAENGRMSTPLAGQGEIVKSGVGTVQLDDLTGFSGSLVVREGTLKMAPEQSADVTVAADATLDVIWAYRDDDTEKTITSGSLQVDGTVMLNGEPLVEWKLEDGKLVRLAASTPFTLLSSESGNFTNLSWRGENGIAVRPDRWTSPVQAAFMTVAEGVDQELSIDSSLQIGRLSVENAGELTFAVAEGVTFDCLKATQLDNRGRLCLKGVGAKLDLAGGVVSNLCGSGTVYDSVGGGRVIVTGVFDTNLTYNCAVEFAAGSVVEVEEDALVFNPIRLGTGTVAAFRGAVRVGGELSPVGRRVVEGQLVQERDSISINVIGGNKGRGGKSLTSGFAGVYPVGAGDWNQYQGRSDNSAFNVTESRVVERLAGGASDAGLLLATLSGNCTYSCGQNGTTPNGALLYGYIDDGNYNSSGRGAGIVVENIPYSQYDVYVYMGSDSDGGAFGAVKVGDSWYPLEKTGWGNRAQSRVANPTLQENVNYRRIAGLTAKTLTVYGATGGSPSGTRCGVAGLQIVNTGVRYEMSRYSAKITEPEVAWQNGQGTGLAEHGDWINSEYSTMTLTNLVGDARLAFDGDVVASRIAVVSESDRALTLSSGDASAVSASSIDASGAKGDLTLDFATGAATLLPGANMILKNAPTVGVVIPAGRRLTLDWNSETAYSAVLSGAGSVDVTGKVKLSANNSLTGAMTVRNGGVLKMGQNNCLNASDAVTVETGGQLDLNGVDNRTLYVTLDGGTVCNTGSDLNLNHVQLKQLTVVADSELLVNRRFGLISNGWNGGAIALGTNTLTKSGSAEFWLSGCTISGSGTIRQTDGTLTVTKNDPTMAEGTFRLDGGTLKVESGRTFRMHGLTLTGGSVSNSGTLADLAVLNGDIDFSNLGTVTFADTVTVESGLVTLDAKAGQALNGKTIRIELAGRALEDGQMVLKWAEKPSATIELVGLDESAYAAEETVDGIKVVRLKTGVVPAEQGESSKPVGEGESAVITITPKEGVGALDVTPPDGYLGKYEIPVTVTNITGVAIERLIIRSGDFDIAPACKIEGTMILLDATKSVTVGSEQIPVRPTLAEAEGTVVPFEVKGDSASTVVKTVPGLLYRLMRGNTPQRIEEGVASERATSERLELTDPEKPADKAFYKISVSR